MPTLVSTGQITIVDANDGVNGTRVGFLEVYQWGAAAPAAAPALPTGTSTYTWATGAFTAPSTPAGWRLTPGAAVVGQTLWATSVRVSNSLTTLTSSVTWAGGSAYAVGAAGTNGATGPSVVVNANRTTTFTATDEILDGSQADIIFTATVSGVTSPTYVWTFSGFQTSPTNSDAATQTITSDQFGNSKAATVTCTVGTHKDVTSIVRLQGSTAAAGATVNIFTSGLLSARPTGDNGDTYFATDTQVLYQKIAGAWTSSSNLQNLSDAADVGEVYNSSGTIVGGDGRPAGVKSMYGSAVVADVSYQDVARTIVKLYSATDSSTGMAWSAFRVNPSTTYNIFIRIKSNVAAASGLYFRMYELDTEMPVGTTYIHNGTGESGGTTGTRAMSTFRENQAITTSWVEFNFSYTPTATAKWVSPFFLNWTGMGLTELHVDKVVITSLATVGATAQQATDIADRVSKSNASILSSTVSLDATEGAGFRAGSLTWNASGERDDGHGVAMTPGGLVGYKPDGTNTFKIDATTGDVYFAGTLAAGTATFDAIVGNSSTEFISATHMVNNNTWGAYYFDMRHPGVASVLLTVGFNTSNVTNSTYYFYSIITSSDVAPATLDGITRQTGAGDATVSLTMPTVSRDIGRYYIWVAAAIGYAGPEHKFSFTVLRSYR